MSSAAAEASTVQGAEGPPPEATPPQPKPQTLREARRKRLASHDSERYLRFLEVGGARASLTKACAALKIAKGTVRNWRVEVAGFKEREDALREKFAKQKKRGGTPDAPEVPITASGAQRFNPDGLTPQQIDYLSNLIMLDGHRIEAARASDVAWAEVKHWLKSSARFATEYAEIRDEMLVSNEDSVGKKGAKGDTAAARMFLSVNDPRYQQRGRAGGGDGDADPRSGVNATGVQRESEDWLTQFAAQAAQATLEPAEVTEPAPTEDDEEVESEPEDDEAEASG